VVTNRNKGNSEINCRGVKKKNDGEAVNVGSIVDVCAP
jgi:hypothetical protein